MSDISIRVEGHAGRITLTRPQALNAMSYEMSLAIEEALDRWADDDSVRVVIIDAEGEKAFCAGANIKEFEKNTYASRLLGVNYLRKLQVAFHEFKKVVIVAVNGLALGGGFELALLGDLILATEDARFGFPEIKLGVFPGMRGTLIAKTVGRYRASRMIFTGEMVSAREMHQAGRIYSKSN